MSERVNYSRLYLRNWMLLLLSFFVPLVLAVPFVLLARRGPDANFFLQLLSLGSLACGAGFFLASNQRELMGRAFTFLLPGFRNGLQRQHLTAVGLLILLTCVLTKVLPSFTQLDISPVVLAIGLSGMMATLYWLTVLIVFHFSYSSFLPFNSLVIVWLASSIWGRLPAARLAPVLDQPVIWGALALGSTWWALDRLAKPGLHRRCCEEPYLPVSQTRDPARVEQFKQARRRNTTEDGEHRPGHTLMRRMQRWTRGQWARDHRSRGLLGEGLTLFLFLSIPRRRMRLVLMNLLVVVMIIGLGYFEGYQAIGQPLYPGYFGGMGFMWAIWTVQAFHGLKQRPLGMLHARRDQMRAGWLGAVLVLAASLLQSGLIWLVNLAAAAWLPDLTWGSHTLEFTMPLAYIPWLPLGYVPLSLLVFSLWRPRGSALVLQHAGTIGFFLFHLLMLEGNDLVRGLAIGLAIGLWLVWPWMWRRRVNRMDLA